MRAAATENGSAFTLGALRLLLLTGRRSGEVLGLEWRDVDLDRGALTLRDSKVGPRSYTLPAPACGLLASLPRVEGDPRVFPITEWPLRVAWADVKRRAKIKDCRVHDLRHAFASVAASREALFVVGKLLGHQPPSMTGRYAHLGTDAIREAAERVAGDMARALDGTSPRRQPSGATDGR